MSGAWYYDADIPSNFTAAGGVAGLGEIVDAAAKQMALVDNTNAASVAMTQAYDNRIAAIKAATGQGLENPIRQAQADLSAKIGTIDPSLAGAQANPALSDQFGPPMPTSVERHGQDFTNRLRALQQQFPQFADVIRADVPIEKDAEALAKAADERLNLLSSTRSLIPQLAANLVGGFEGSLNDPLQVSTMFLGGGASAGRTLLARIGNVALKEALINGAVTASMQPDVQAWRGKAGLPHGFDEGLKNTLFAAGLGAALGSGGELIGHLLGAGGKHVLTGDTLDAVAEVLRQKANLRPDINAALAGDHDAALTALRPIRDALAPEARAAVDLHESISAARDSVPNVSSPAVHQANMDAAEKIAVDPRTVFSPQLDPAKVDRIVNDLVPEAPAARKSDRQGLAEFLTRAGGVQDQGGELSALGLQNVSQKFVGRLVKDSGMPLDRARELAAEAGFFNHRYGTPEAATARSTVADLLDELDNEGKRPGDNRPDDGGRAYVESRVTELMQQVGPEVDEKLIGKAVQLAEAEKMPLLEAFDRVAIEDDASRYPEFVRPAEQQARPAATPEAGLPDAAPGFIDRQDDPLALPTPEAEPSADPEEALFTPADLEGIDAYENLPFFDDGTTINGQAVIDDLEELHGLFQLTEACKA